MRRNSNLLRKNPMRSGMAMIMAIGFLVIMAGMMATMLNMSATKAAETEYKYFRGQAQLLAQSATEYALLAISGHNKLANTSCVVTINSTFPDAAYFNITTTIRYIGLAGAAGTCAANNFVPVGAFTTGAIAPESDGTVLIDVYVRSIDPVLNLSAPIAFHHRTMQKP